MQINTHVTALQFFLVINEVNGWLNNYLACIAPPEVKLLKKIPTGNAHNVDNRMRSTDPE